MGRARGGRSMAWDPRGTVNAGGTAKAQSVDSLTFADKNREMTNKSAASAMYADYYDGIQLKEDGSHNQVDFALAQMSQLQKRQLDKDGDGKFSQSELKAYGFDTGLGPG